MTKKLGLTKTEIILFVLALLSTGLVSAAIGADAAQYACESKKSGSVIEEVQP